MAHSRETGVSWKPELPTAAQHPTRGGAAPRQEGGMTSVLFTNVRIFDGTGALAYPGEILVQGISPFHKDPHKEPARGQFRRSAA